jgi:hypothetical protein
MEHDVRRGHCYTGGSVKVGSLGSVTP